MGGEKNMRIYGHRYAGRRAVQLFEELAELQMNQNGEVFIRRTLKNSKPGNPPIKYPPVYSVIYMPNFWQQINREIASLLFDIGDKYSCKVVFRVENGNAVAVFEDGGTRLGN